MLVQLGVKRPIITRPLLERASAGAAGGKSHLPISGIKGVAGLPRQSGDWTRIGAYGMRRVSKVGAVTSYHSRAGYHGHVERNLQLVERKHLGNTLHHLATGPVRWRR